MANTREVLGDQATLDALVSNTLETFEDDTFSRILENAFYHNSGLKTVDLAGTGDLYIGRDAFYECANLTQLVIRSNKVATVYADYSLRYTPIANRKGAVFVPDNLVDAYNLDKTWRAYIILPVSRFPTTDYSTIADSWNEIFAAEEDGSYLEKYKVGDTKLFYDGTRNVVMQIAAMDADDFANGSGKAKITWISRFLNESHKMFDSSTNVSPGIGGSSLQAWLEGTIWNKIPAEVRAGIKQVKKKSMCLVDDTTLTMVENNFRIWIPSARELFGGSSYETEGPVYSGLFPNNDARIKTNEYGSAYSYWTRTSTSNNGYYAGIDNTGKMVPNLVTNGPPVAIGFCT
ncbi:MAG: hypothetical protein IJ899_12750 [Blautia sp.]|nr:hypothetical protein [Blautia sp.]